MLLATAVLMSSTAGPPAFVSTGELQRWLTYYYRQPRPELVLAALTALETELPRHGSTLEAQAGRGGMRSFFGLVLAKSPAAVVAIESHPFAPGTRRFLAEALRRCGTDACAEALVHWGEDAGRPVLDVRTAPLDSRAAIDDLWAAYSATGDRAYVERVITALPEDADARASSSGPEITALAVRASAQRSLTSIAAADADVLALCEEVAVTPGTPAARRAVLEDIVRQARDARDQGNEP
jgi:hypothetical protein